MTRGKTGSISLSWTDHGSMITKHEVLVYQYTRPTRKNPSAGYTLARTLTTTNSYVNVTGLAKKYTYVFTVNATNPLGPGPHFEYSRVGFSGPPPGRRAR